MKQDENDWWKWDMKMRDKTIKKENEKIETNQNETKNKYKKYLYNSIDIL